MPPTIEARCDKRGIFHHAITMEARDRGIAQSLGAPLFKKVKTSRVLLVGAGGIGCELLKNLVCSGFGSGFHAPPTSNGTRAEEEQEEHGREAEIVVIDLDTIDLSNLNRQFLFRKQHIKKSKAFVAKETAGQFNPYVNLDARHASIFDSQFDVEFFAGFDLVFNALDNLAARRHVNRMCLAADVPLIESGTTGFNGQVQAIQRGVTECYDCNEKPVQKSYPICTIRSTPSQPIHCIVWAKSYLLPELFGTSEEESADVVVTEADNADEVAKLKEEAEALKNVRSLMGKSEFAKELFNKVFHDDIERLRSISDMWQSRTPPEPLRFESLSIDPNLVEQGATLANQDQSVWTLLDNLKVFCYSIDALSKRVQAEDKVIEFDKDDKDTLDFVASAANLRAHVFGISLNSEWEIKQMAGNIIPAIATSNALTASLCVLQAFKILRTQLSTSNGVSQPVKQAQITGPKDHRLLGGAKMVFLTSRNTERMITSQPLAPPKPGCAVCSPIYAKLALPKDDSPTLEKLVNTLKSRLPYEDFSMTTEAGLIYDPDLTDNLTKSLSDLGIERENNGFITVMDDSDEPKVDLLISVNRQPTESSDLQLLPETIELPPKTKLPHTNGDTANEMDPEPVLLSASAGEKRKREAEGDIDTPKKKAKAIGDDASVIVEEGEDHTGAILLD